MAAKIDGWLLAFLAACVLTSLIYLALLATRMNEIADYQRFHGAMPRMLIAWDCGLTVVRIVTPLLIVWRMAKHRHWGSVRFAIAALWFLFLGMPLIDLAWAMLNTGPVFLDKATHFIIPQLARGIFFAGSATLYLLRARRVANVYRHAPMGAVFD